jgi:hypothetical protein
MVFCNERKVKSGASLAREPAKLGAAAYYIILQISYLGTKGWRPTLLRLGGFYYAKIAPGIDSYRVVS